MLADLSLSLIFIRPLQNGSCLFRDGRLFQATAPPIVRAPHLRYPFLSLGDSAPPTPIFFSTCFFFFLPRAPVSVQALRNAGRPCRHRFPAVAPPFFFSDGVRGRLAPSSTLPPAVFIYARGRSCAPAALKRPLRRVSSPLAIFSHRLSAGQRCSSLVL